MPSLVLMYHRVAVLPLDPWSLAVTPSHFAEHLEVLGRLTDVVPLGEIREAARNARPRVAITFDDGYADNLTAALPLLERFGMPATCFVATGQVGGRREFWWDELEALLLVPPQLPVRLRLGIDGQMREWSVPSDDRGVLFRELWQLLQPLPPRRQAAALNALRSWAGLLPPGARETHRTMTIDQLVTFGSHPLITLGAHTEHHPILKGLAPRTTQREIAGSAATLEQLTGVTPRHFAYPYGAEDDLVRDLVRRAGFELAFTTEERLLQAEEHPLALPRFEVRDGDGDRFAENLTGWFSGGAP
jgi:peptidoglycan/xylan/chitin deacetylase (PgdA/CDA1 family)